jgi:hypothetical protein
MFDEPTIFCFKNDKKSVYSLKVKNSNGRILLLKKEIVPLFMALFSTIKGDNFKLDVEDKEDLIEFADQ